MNIYNINFAPYILNFESCHVYLLSNENDSFFNIVNSCHHDTIGQIPSYKGWTSIMVHNNRTNAAYLWKEICDDLQFHQYHQDKQRPLSSNYWTRTTHKRKKIHMELEKYDSRFNGQHPHILL